MGVRKTLTNFLDEVKGIHGNKYNYSKVNYVNSHTKIIITCYKHGDFEQRPHRHIQGDGCRECSKKQQSEKMGLGLPKFLDKSNNLHNNKYDYSFVNYINNRTKIKIICPIHGEFEQTPGTHLSGGGCKSCGYIKAKLFNTKTTDDFISQSMIVHGEKYDYSNVDYVNTDEKLEIICKRHGRFYQKPYKHLQGQGCPICKESKLEIKVRDFLIKNNINFISQYGKKNKIKWLNQLSLDFYLIDYNIAIECQGEQHFKPVDFGNKGDEYSIEKFKIDYERDKFKFFLCLENDVKILYYTDKITTITEGYFSIVYTELDDLLKMVKK
jgi:hypothetical protein